MASLVKLAINNGVPISIAAITTPGTLIWTAIDAFTTVDELYLWATNQDATDRTLAFEWGASLPLMRFIVPAGDTILAAGGMVIAGGLLVRAYCSPTGQVSVQGFCNRITTP